jgi:hypothetical protein
VVGVADVVKAGVLVLKVAAQFVALDKAIDVILTTLAVPAVPNVEVVNCPEPEPHELMVAVAGEPEDPTVLVPVT